MTLHQQHIYDKDSEIILLVIWNYRKIIPNFEHQQRRKKEINLFPTISKAKLFLLIERSLTAETFVYF